MFEAAETGHKLSKGEFKRIEPQLRADLLDAQYELSKLGRFPVVILISGVRGAGKGETVNLLNAWMDPRHIHTHAFDNPTDEERDRPPMWRYWRALPPKGRIGMLFGSWYTAPIIDRVFKRTRPGDLLQSLDEIRRFERMLADDPEAGSAVLLTARQHAAAAAAARGLAAARELLASPAPLELVAVEARGALEALGQLTGERVAEDVLDRLFARFCIGK